MTSEQDREIEADRQAIIRLLTTYARAVDTKDWDRYETVFTPDAVIDYTSSGGIRGTRAEARAWVSEALEIFTMTQHIVTNHDITVDGDTATSYADFYNPLGRPDGEGGQALLFVGGAYRDELRRTADGWRITHRVEDMFWFTGAWPDEVVVDVDVVVE